AQQGRRIAGRSASYVGGLAGRRRGRGGGAKHVGSNGQRGRSAVGHQDRYRQRSNRNSAAGGSALVSKGLRQEADHKSACHSCLESAEQARRSSTLLRRALDRVKVGGADGRRRQNHAGAYFLR